MCSFTPLKSQKMRFKFSQPSRNTPQSKKDNCKRILHSFSFLLKANDISHHENTSKLLFMSLSASSLYHVHIIISSRNFSYFSSLSNLSSIYPFIHATSYYFVKYYALFHFLIFSCFFMSFAREDLSFLFHFFSM